MNGSDPSLHIILLSRPHTFLDFLMFRGTAGQSSSNRSNIRPSYLNNLTPSMYSTSSSPVRLKVSSEHPSAIATSLICHLIWVFLSQRAVLWYLMRRLTGMCIPNKSQQGRNLAPSWTNATFDWRWRYMKCLRSCPAL